jgi:hypothetical protein
MNLQISQSSILDISLFEQNADITTLITKHFHDGIKYASFDINIIMLKMLVNSFT